MPTLQKSSASSLAILTLLLIPLFLSITVRSVDDNPFLLPSDQEINNDHSICPFPFNPAFCPVACLLPDPVCGVDGITYWCGCDSAHCAGVLVAKLGCCEVRNWRSLSCFRAGSPDIEAIQPECNQPKKYV